MSFRPVSAGLLQRLGLAVPGFLRPTQKPCRHGRGLLHPHALVQQRRKQGMRLHAGRIAALLRLGAALDVPDDLGAVGMGAAGFSLVTVMLITPAPSGTLVETTRF